MFVSGCAHHERESTIVVPSNTATTLTPTSDRDVARVYSKEVRGIGEYAPPPGAPPQDWALAEQIRAKLTADPKLAKEPMKAEVKDGVVTLRGYVPNERARDRIRAEVATVPGVRQVNDQMNTGHVLKNIPGEGY